VFVGHVAPYNRETVQDHYAKLEVKLDNAIACDILNLLAKDGRLGTIPKKPHRGSRFRHLTKKELKPVLSIPKALPDRLQEWPVHLREFWGHLSSVSPQIKRLLLNQKNVEGRERLLTSNVYNRGANLVKSGFISHISVGKDDSLPGAWLVMVKNYPSMKMDHNLTCLRLVSGNPLGESICSCLDG
jgi:hypothetical protein